MKVRIAVAVGPDGKWCASGWSCIDGTPNEKYAMDASVAHVGSAASCYFIEAELPVPEVQTIQGTIAPRGPE